MVQRHAAALHAAIEGKDSTTVRELFSLGGVHINMILDNTHGSRIRPLDRAAFTGDAKVMCVLLNEIPETWPSDVKSDVLDARTDLGYTPYMLACQCGHTEVAQQLPTKGCDDTLMNSSGKNRHEALRSVQVRG